MIHDNSEHNREDSPTPEQTTRQLFEAVYDELRVVAGQMMLRERIEHTLSATALVNESYLRLATSKNTFWETRGHFFSAVAEAMRRILIDRARARNTLKRGRRREQVDMDQLLDSPHWLFELNDRIEQLAEEDPQAAEFVKLRVFAGLNVIDAGQALGLRKGAAYQLWDFVRRWFATGER